MKPSIFFIIKFWLSIIDDTTCFDFKIQNENIYLNKDSREIVLNFSASNCSSKSLILYNINSVVLPPIIHEDEFCKEDVAAGLALYIYNESNEAIFPEMPIIPDSIDYKPMSKDNLESKLANSRIEFVRSTKIIKPKQKIDFSKTIKLHSYGLEKGTYYIRLIYFSGKYITNYVDQKYIAQNKTKYEANVFQGCAKSNKIKLIIE
ncbi:MAG: hypothetical protein HYZ44_03645 [Bacteroidetes bacterium]|nr:hypothetical protein [Bacteroidota bacterium]